MMKPFMPFVRPARAAAPAILAVLLGVMWPAAAHAKLQVVATLPDLAAIARDVGGDRVDVTCIGKPNEDPHYVQAKPSFIVTLNKADVLIENGLDLEIGWLPALVDQTRNTKIRPGTPGRIVAATGMPLIEIPTEAVTRAMGDVHPGGNPHFMLDPERGRVAAQTIADGLSRVSPADADAFRANLANLVKRIDESEASCKASIEPYRGTKVVTYHKSLTYFCQRFGLEEVDNIEPKPGIPPSPSHLGDLISEIKQNGAKLILMEPWHERRSPDLVAQQAGVKVVEVPAQVGAQSDIPDYPALCKAIVARVVEALK